MAWKNNYWWSFREELLATSVVLVVAVSGSFFLVSRMYSESQVEQSPVSSEKTEIETENKVLGEAITNTPLPSPTTLPTTIPTPTSNPYASEVFYGTGGLYDYPEYTLGLSSPRITFDAREASSRRFMVDVTLTNKSVSAGLAPNISASIIKDGVVIVPSAPLSVTNYALVLPGEQKQFEARLSLIEGTDISVLKFTPESVVPVEHILRP